VRVLALSNQLAGLVEERLCGGLLGGLAGLLCAGERGEGEDRGQRRDPRANHQLRLPPKGSAEGPGLLVGVAGFFATGTIGLAVAVTLGSMSGRSLGVGAAVTTGTGCGAAVVA